MSTVNAHSNRQRLLTSRDVADWIGVSARTVCLWAELGELPALRVGRQWRFRATELEAWLHRKANAPDSPAVQQGSTTDVNRSQDYTSARVSRAQTSAE